MVSVNLSAAGTVGNIQAMENAIMDSDLMEVCLDNSAKHYGV